MTINGFLYCDVPGCEALGVFHVTVNVEVFGPASTRAKRAQFWLCERHEKDSQKVLARDWAQKGRVAQALSAAPKTIGMV
jgi:hypothetical protein